jgi:hypothetical protein
MNRVIVSEREEAVPADSFGGRHPVLIYVFGDTVKGLYLVGCLALDLFLPAQVRLSYPGYDPILLSLAAVGIVVLTYAELKLYRRLWPRRGRRMVEVVEGPES